ANMTTPLATGNYVGGQGQGYVRFDQPAMLNVAASQIKYLVLKGVVNGSAAMNAASTSAWMLSESTASLPTGATYDDDTDNIKISKASGGNLADAAIDIGNNGANDNNATSTWYLFHNTAPVITNVALDTSLQISSQAPVFKYTISNPGDRELRLSTTTVVMSASGLAAAGASGTGTIAGFQLWEANASGGLATQLATNTMAAGTLGCIAGSSVAPGMTVAGSGNCVGATTTLTLTFGPVNDTNSLMDNFTIAAGGSRTFVVVADTTNILTGKTTGSVSVYGKLDGATGFESGDTDDEDNWADGVVTYFYTPVNGSENTSANAYSASDSYDVIGTTLNKTI
ncbi:MAG TPA: hypothetical protein VEA18_03720, partial [Candidatus Kapabacteria bacterium]|nr:hypothetical protein [Candidatus Kapabacteria bacterium]